jgi:hypothetical protein
MKEYQDGIRSLGTNTICPFPCSFSANLLPARIDQALLSRNGCFLLCPNSCQYFNTLSSNCEVLRRDKTASNFRGYFSLRILELLNTVPDNAAMILSCPTSWRNMQKLQPLESPWYLHENSHPETSFSKKGVTNISCDTHATNPH